MSVNDVYAVRNDAMSPMSIPLKCTCENSRAMSKTLLISIMLFDVVVSGDASRTICRYLYKDREPFFDVLPLVTTRLKRDQRNVPQ